MRRHIPLLLLCILFILPAVTAYILLQKPNILTVNSSAHGKFIQPPYKIDLSKANLNTGTATENKWSMIIVGSKIDDVTMFKLTQLHKSLGADSDRVAIGTIARNALSYEIEDDSILIINPQGLYIMQYVALEDFTLLLKDIRRLLKYSHV